ncbi:MAG: hypothetical protein CVV37_01165 [Nitrospira bacterium HGW-Nitrospira-1]|nr:MAG: hypothetical protein CVV37_01165 [Nitrospira bacterium HGW-Nitrospira-1]
MHNQSNLGIILILIGLFPILAVWFKWKFFLENWRAQWVKDIMGEGGMRVFYALFGCALIIAGLLIIFRIIGPEVEGIKKGDVIQGEVTEEELIAELGLRKEFYYGIKVLANENNQQLIKKALEIMKEKTPEFFELVVNNIKEIRQSKGLFTMGPIKLVGGTDRVEFSNFAGQYSEYNAAVFLVHEAAHIVDQRKGLPQTKEAEIRAREAEIAFLQALGKVEGHDFESFIKFVENEIDMIKKGHLYRDLP